MNLTKWTRPNSYCGTQFPEYYLGLGQHRDSDTLTRCNFAVALDRLGGESETVIVTRASHWAVGWLETILVHESDADKLAILSQIQSDLDDYPILDESEFCEMEQAELAETHEWNSDEFAREVAKVLDVELDTLTRTEVDQVTMRVLQDDAGYRGQPGAWVCAQSIARTASSKYSTLSYDADHGNSVAKRLLQKFQKESA